MRNINKKYIRTKYGVYNLYNYDGVRYSDAIKESDELSELIDAYICESNEDFNDYHIQYDSISELIESDQYKKYKEHYNFYCCIYIKGIGYIKCGKIVKYYSMDYIQVKGYGNIFIVLDNDYAFGINLVCGYHMHSIVNKELAALHFIKRKSKKNYNLALCVDSGTYETYCEQFDYFLNKYNKKGGPFEILEEDKFSFEEYKLLKEVLL